MKRVLLTATLAFAVAVTVTTRPAAAQTENKIDRRLKKATVDQLFEMLGEGPRYVDFGGDDTLHFDRVLKELIRRRDKEIVPRLRKVLRDEQTAEAYELDGGPSQESGGKSMEVALAIEQILNKPEPVVVDVLTAKIEGGTRIPPTISVRVRNASDEPLHYASGGDYRSGRQARWRVHLWDEQGKLLPVRGMLAPVGGGLFFVTMLDPKQHGKTIKLDLFNFVRIPKAGRYTAQFYYHNNECLADLSSEQFEQVVVAKSKKVPIVITKGPLYEVTLKPGDAYKAKLLIELYDESQELLIAQDGYGKHQHEFIEPDSKYGTLLAMGDAAVPALIEALDAPKLNFKRRAWILVALHAITQERSLNPMQRGILPNYRWNAAHGQGSRNILATQHDEAKQKEFAKKWLDFRKDYLRVKK